MNEIRKFSLSTQVSSTVNQLTQKNGLLFQDSLDSKSLSAQIQKYFPTFRDRIYDPVTTLFAFLSQVISPDRSCTETVARVIKTVLNMHHLRAKTPSMARKEIWTTLLAYNLIRRLIGESAYRHDTLPCELSFKGAVQHLNAFRPLWVLSTRPSKEVLNALLLLIAKLRVANRPGRSEPRALKKRARTYAYLVKPRAEVRNTILHGKTR